MIIKKPYIFLIKHFRKIHIFLLILGIFILIKHLPISTFITEFVDLGVYDSMNNPISKYIPGYEFLILFITLIINLLLIGLLKYKEKPWKMYLIPIATYSLMILVYFLVVTYFNSYNGVLERTQISLYRDLINIFSLLQLPCLGIYLFRCIGLDLKKFNFNLDQEFLELTDDDQVELEINVDIDKAAVKRVGKRVLRHLNYFVQEHKKIVIAVLVVIIVFTGYKVYKTQFVENKSYTQNDNYFANGYEINIEDSYYTDKDNSGKKISKYSSFVVIRVKMTNKSAPRIINIDNFHLYNGVKNYTQMCNRFAPKFEDIGKIYDQKTEIKRDETTEFILIFRVDNKLKKSQFVLYYQEINGDSTHLRKIKINTQDISNIKDNGYLKLGEEMKVKVSGDNTTESLAPTGYAFYGRVNFIVQNCTFTCVNEDMQLTAKDGHKIMQITYMTEEFVAKDIIDFSSKYGTINYIDSNDKEKKIKMENATEYNYLGQYAYVDVPEEIANSKKLELVYTVRNNKYTYKLKG